MKRLCTLLAVAVAMAALAVPAFAQDPYGEVLPGDIIRPVDDDVVAPPDEGDGAVLPGDVERTPDSAPGEVGSGEVAPGGVSAPGDVGSGEASAPDVVGAGQVGAAPSEVTAARQLPVTGGQLTIALLVLGAVLTAGGAGAVTVARKRAASPQQ